MAWQTKSVETWKLYHLHSQYLEEHRLSANDMKLEPLTVFASGVWLKETKHRSRVYKCPSIEFGEGMKQGVAGDLTSYCEGRSKIVLVPGQRNKIVLLHELTHALGPVGHGRTFTDMYFRLLLTYTNISKKWLRAHVEKSGLTFPVYE